LRWGLTKSCPAKGGEGGSRRSRETEGAARSADSDAAYGKNQRGNVSRAEINEMAKLMKDLKAEGRQN
jgi:hypothetical protein